MLTLFIKGENRTERFENMEKFRERYPAGMHFTRPVNLGPATEDWLLVSYPGRFLDSNGGYYGILIPD